MGHRCYLTFGLCQNRLECFPLARFLNLFWPFIQCFRQHQKVKRNGVSKLLNILSFVKQARVFSTCKISQSFWAFHSMFQVMSKNEKKWGIDVTKHFLSLSKQARVFSTCKISQSFWAFHSMFQAASKSERNGVSKFLNILSFVKQARVFSTHKFVCLF